MTSIVHRVAAASVLALLSPFASGSSSATPPDEPLLPIDVTSPDAGPDGIVYVEAGGTVEITGRCAPLLGLLELPVALTVSVVQSVGDLFDTLDDIITVADDEGEWTVDWLVPDGVGHVVINSYCLPLGAAIDALVGGYPAELSVEVVVVDQAPPPPTTVPSTMAPSSTAPPATSPATTAPPSTTAPTTAPPPATVPSTTTTPATTMAPGTGITELNPTTELPATE